MSYTIIRPATHADWLKERQSGIGSSEATILMGVNHYEKQTPYNLFRRKTGLEPIEEIPEEEMWTYKEAMWLGHMKEPMIAACFAAKTGAYIIPESEGDWIAVDKDKPYLRVSPDRLYIPKGKENKMENWCICECKTSSVTIDRDNIPAYWYCQLQYQMGVMGIKHGAISWETSFPKAHHDFVEFDFNPAYYQLLVNTIEDFWYNNVLAGVCPPAETIEDSRDIFARTKPKIEGNFLAADNDMIARYDRMIEINSIMETLNKEYKELEETFEKTILDGKYEAIRNGNADLAVNTPPNKKKALDLIALKAAEPQIFAKYSETVNSVSFDNDSFKADEPELYKKYYVKPPAGDPKFKMVFPKKKSDRKQEGIFTS